MREEAGRGIAGELGCRERESVVRVEDKVVEKEETRRTGEASSALSEDRSDVRQDPSWTDGPTDRPTDLSLTTVG